MPMKDIQHYENASVMSGTTKIVSTPGMEKIPFGLQFFDQNDVLYVSPEIYGKVDRKEIANINFATVAFRSQDMTIHELIARIKQDVYDMLAEKSE